MSNRTPLLSPPDATRPRLLPAVLACLGLALAFPTGASHADDASSPAGDRAARADLQALQRVDRLLAEGEAAYQERRDQQAFAAFGQVAAIAPADARAWLRIGNLWQRNGEAWRAIEAYRRAVSGAPGDPPGTDGATAPRGEAQLQARSRAAFNLAAIGLDQARAAMQAVDRARLPATMQPAAEALERRLRAADAIDHEPVRPTPP